MVATAVMNYVLGFLINITLVYTLGNLNEVLDSPTGQPFIQVILNATQSKAATIVFLLALALAASAQQRPLLTDDVDITPPGSINLGVGVDFFQRARFPLSGIEGDLTRVGDMLTAGEPSRLC